MENRKTCANPIEKQEVLDTFADESAVSTKTQQCRYKGTNAKHSCHSRITEMPLYLSDFDSCNNVTMRNMKVAVGQFTVTEKPEHNISIISGFTSERHAIMHGYCCCRKV